ncbi:MAG: hypothetical protein KGM42_01500 [Hyphomicrobiales bacterium]|nr:hypothetical protein [Hyphomicrobiales bacterium]
MRRATAAAVLALTFVSGVSRAETAANLYLLHCSGCHGLDGIGSRTGRVPPFPGFLGPIAKARNGRAYLVLVPGVANADLQDADAAAVLNYALRTWANGAGADFSPDEVKDIRKHPVQDIIGVRNGIAAELKAQGVSIAY